MSGLLTSLWIAFGATIGSWLRWILGLALDPVLPMLPLGTLMANLVGSFLMGIFLALSRDHGWLSPQAQLSIGTGFLGGLTTFSTFSGEIAQLIDSRDYLWISIALSCHVGGSILMTLFGLYTVRVVTA